MKEDSSVLFGHSMQKLWKFKFPLIDDLKFGSVAIMGVPTCLTTYVNVLQRITKSELGSEFGIYDLPAKRVMLSFSGILWTLRIWLS